METYTIHPKDKAQASAVKAFLKALKVPFETEPEVELKSIYSAEFNEKMKRAEEDLKAGRYKSIKTADLWK